MNIIVTSPSFGHYNLSQINALHEKGWNFEYIVPYDRQRLIELLPKADGLISGVESIDTDIISAGVALKVIAKHGVGVDNIDVAAATARNIKVVNSPGTNSEAVADLAFGLMLSAARKIPQSHKDLKQNQWKKVTGVSVYEKTVGIIGLGAIGRGVAERASGFQMKILGYDVSSPSRQEQELGIERTTLDRLLEESDYITLHAPLTKQTYHMIDSEVLKKMGPQSMIINTARGELIDENALYRALISNTIGGAALDVFENEPRIEPHLLELENLIVTPHMAAYTIEATKQTSELTLRNVQEVLNEMSCENVINN